MAVQKRFSKGSVTDHFAEVIAEVGLLRYSATLYVDKVVEEKKAGFLSVDISNYSPQHVTLSGSGFRAEVVFLRNQVARCQLISFWTLPNPANFQCRHCGLTCHNQLDLNRHLGGSSPGPAYASKRCKCPALI